MSTNASERIAEAIASTCQPVGEARWASLVVPPPESREDALAVISETRRLIVTAEWHAAEMHGATWEMSQNAKRRLPVLRAEVSRAELALRVLDEIDAEPPQPGLLDSVGALFAVAMLAAMTPAAVLAIAMTTPTPIPDRLREAFDAAVNARNRLDSTFSMPSSRERVTARRAAVNDLHAANRVLAAHDPKLVEQAGRAASDGGAR